MQSNNLIEAHYDTDLTALEHKILRYAASKIKDNSGSFPDISFTLTEFLNVCGIKGKGYYTRVEKIADELTRKRIKIKTTEKTGWFPWFSGIIYKDGHIHMKFNELVKPLLLELEGQFTKYNYKYIGDMQSGYTIRLFEILKQYAPIGKRRISVDILKRMLGIENKYEQYGQFKLRVLNQAKKELDEKKGLTFEFDEIKEGRKVKELVFYIHLKEPKIALKEVAAAGNSFIQEARFLLESYSFEIPDRTLQNWQKYGIDLLGSVLGEIKDNKIDHPVPYIEKVLSTKYNERLKLESDLLADTEEAKQLMAVFIQKSASQEPLPQWMVKEDFEEFMKSSYDREEIQQLWETNGEYICQARWKKNK